MGGVCRCPLREICRCLLREICRCLLRQVCRCLLVQVHRCLLGEVRSLAGRWCKHTDCLHTKRSLGDTPAWCGTGRGLHPPARPDGEGHRDSTQLLD